MIETICPTWQYTISNKLFQKKFWQKQLFQKKFWQKRTNKLFWKSFDKNKQKQTFSKKVLTKTNKNNFFKKSFDKNKQKLFWKSLDKNKLYLCIPSLFQTNSTLSNTFSVCKLLLHILKIIGGHKSSKTKNNSAGMQRLELALFATLQQSNCSNNTYYIIVSTIIINATSTTVIAVNPKCVTMPFVT